MTRTAKRAVLVASLAIAAVAITVTHGSARTSESAMPRASDRYDAYDGGRLPTRRLYEPIEPIVITVPRRRLGVTLDRDKLGEYHELYRRLGTYPYDQDPLRPGWTPLVPNDRWADPRDTHESWSQSLANRHADDA